MLFKQNELNDIQAGRITLAFRRWRRPTVKAGGTLKTEIGLLAIDSITIVDDLSGISESDAKKTGYDLETLRASLLARRNGDIYRIAFLYSGPDPRIALREDKNLSVQELETITEKLRRLDAASKTGPWTHRVLSAIRQHPHLAAAELAGHTGTEKDWLKINIRKLKNHGLTISHQPGYELSPRGTVVLKHLNAEQE